jgi:hypothetical protein
MTLPAHDQHDQRAEGTPPPTLLKPPGGEPTSAELPDRQMRLRYSGACRLCGTALPAGTHAIYEAGRRTVRCIECVSGALEAGETAGQVVSASPPAPATPPTPARLETSSAPATEDLARRAPASSVIAETLRLQSDVPTRSRIARFFGRTPLSVESQTWYRGALGELEVARVLTQLDPGWTAIHAIPVGTKGSDIDHLVIGPGGVFTINTKHHQGMKVWVGSKRLLVNGQRTGHLRNAEFEASRTAKLLTTAAGTRVEVVPIVAIVGARSITVRERPANVVVVSSTRLAHWLKKRPVILGAEEIARLRRLAGAADTWGASAPVPADQAAFAELRASVESARIRRVGWGTAVLLSLPAGLLAAASALPVLSSLW